MEDWQTIQQQHSRQHASQGKQQGAPNNNHMGANAGTAENEWPIRPAQTTLENYIQNPSWTQTQIQWGDQDNEPETGS